MAGIRTDIGTTDIPGAGTRVQISSSPLRIQSIMVTGRVGNAGICYFGMVDVSSSNGLEVLPGVERHLHFGYDEAGRALTDDFSRFYVDAAVSGDDIDWSVQIVE